MDGGKSWPRAGHGAAAAGDAEAPAHHLLIAGTGRAGTSFLVRYLSALGLDTNLARRGDNAVWDDRANAGLEDLLLPDPSRLPYVVKSPWTHEFIEELLHCGKVRLDAVILPMRDLVEAAASRATLEMQAAHRELPWMARLEHTWESFRHTAGGIVYSMSPIDQARLLAVGFHRILERLVQADVPVVLMSFPRFVEDADYLFDKLAPVLGAGVSRDAARQAHAALADPAKVRVGRELQSATEAAPGLTLRGPSLVQLDRAALARTLTETRRQVETITEARLHADQKRDELAQDSSGRPPPCGISRRRKRRSSSSSCRRHGQPTPCAWRSATAPSMPTHWPGRRMRCGRNWPPCGHPWPPPWPKRPPSRTGLAASRPARAGKSRPPRNGWSRAFPGWPGCSVTGSDAGRPAGLVLRRARPPAPPRPPRTPPSRSEHEQPQPDRGHAGAAAGDGPPAPRGRDARGIEQHGHHMVTFQHGQKAPFSRNACHVPYRFCALWTPQDRHDRDPDNVHRASGCAQGAWCALSANRQQ